MVTVSLLPESPSVPHILGWKTSTLPVKGILSTGIRTIGNTPVT